MKLWKTCKVNKFVDSSDENQFKKHSGEYHCKTKNQRNLWSYYQGQENVKHFLASAGCLHISKGNKE